MAGFLTGGAGKQAALSVRSSKGLHDAGRTGPAWTHAGDVTADSQSGRVKSFLRLRRDTARSNPDLYDPLAAFLGVSMNELGKAMLSSDVQGLVPARTEAPAPARSFRLSHEYGRSLSLPGHAAH